MGYLKIPNLYKDRTILLFKECFALEKIHGTSSHISWNGSEVGFFSGGASYEEFVKLFNHDELKERFMSIGKEKVIIYGEAYGGKMQGMKETYGNKLKFVAFDVKINDVWLSVEDAFNVAVFMNLDFVPFVRTTTDLYEALNPIRDSYSVQAVKNGIVEPRKREGIVLRPLIEFTKNDGSRVIAKHKADEFMETRTKRPVDEEKLKVLQDAEEIANEWVTEMRLTHVLDKFPNFGIEDTGKVIQAMIKDIEVEAVGEIEMSHEARKAIGGKTAYLFKKRIGEI